MDTKDNRFNFIFLKSPSSVTTGVIALVLLSTAITAQGQLPSYFPKQELVAWYPFSGNADDSSGNKNNGVVFGNVTLTTDRFNNPNKAYNFDGNSGTYIDVPVSATMNIQNALSVAAWIYMDGGYINPRLISFYNGKFEIISIHSLGIANTSRSFDALFVNEDCQTKSGFCCIGDGMTVPALSWQHVVFTVDTAGTASIYLNGVL